MLIPAQLIFIPLLILFIIALNEFFNNKKHDNETRIMNFSIIGIMAMLFLNPAKAFFTEYEKTEEYYSETSNAGISYIVTKDRFLNLNKTFGKNVQSNSLIEIYQQKPYGIFSSYHVKYKIIEPITFKREFKSEENFIPLIPKPEVNFNYGDSH